MTHKNEECRISGWFKRCIKQCAGGKKARSLQAALPIPSELARVNNHSNYVIVISFKYLLFQEDDSSTVVKVLRYKSEGRCFDPR
jgi:hypothetical protein